MPLFLHRTVSERCPGCGAAHAACGPPSGTVPVDAHMMEVSTVGGPLQKYRYRGTVLKLNDADAARLGLDESALVDSPEPDSDGEGEGEVAAQVPAKGRGAANKSRAAAANKGSTRRKPAPADPAGGDQGDAGAAADTGTSTADGGNGGSGGGD